MMMINLPGYKIIRLIAQGGMGQVYLARQERLGRQVAVKVIKNITGIKPSDLAEIQLQVTQDHQYVLKVHDVLLSEDASAIYIVMEYMQGGSLADRMKGKPLPFGLVRRVVMQVGSALAALHQAGIIHRDLKSSNILFDSHRNCRLADFGIAGLIGETAADGLTYGTPSTMAPEQIRGESLDERVDVYAMGCLIYEMLTGRPVFTADTRDAMLEKHLSSEPELPSKLNSNIPPVLDQVILKALEKDPKARFPTLMHLIKAFKEALPKEATDDAYPTESVQIRVVKKKTKRTWLWLFLVVLLFSAGAFIFFGLPRLTADPEETQTSEETSQAETDAVSVNTLPTLTETLSAPSPTVTTTLTPTTSPTPTEIPALVSSDAVVNLSQSEMQSLSPDLVVDPSGSLHVIWVDDRTQEDVQQLIIRTKPIGKDFTDPVMLYEAEHFYLRSPYFVDLPSGEPCLLFDQRQSADVSAYSICDFSISPAPATVFASPDFSWSGFAGDFDQNGTPQFLELDFPKALIEFDDKMLTPLEVSTLNPSLIIDRQNKFHAFWEVIDSDSKLQYAVSMDGGATWSEPIDLKPEGMKTVAGYRVILGADQKLHLLFWDIHSINYRVLDPDAGWGELISLETLSNSIDSRMGFALDEENRPFVVWLDQEGFMVSTLDDAGEEFTSQRLMFYDNLFTIWDIGMAITPDGQKHVIWRQKDGVYISDVMYVQFE